MQKTEISMNILTLSTYPIDNPLHGGQHRLHNIVDAYKSAGHAVQAAGVSGSDQYPAAPGFVPYPGMTAFTPYIANPFLMDDWAIGQLFEKNDHYFTNLADLISPVPDLIHIEQPWLFKFAERFAKLHSSKKIKLIYGSQNIEHDMKFDIVKTYIDIDSAHAAQELVLRCETAAIALADGVCCVSQDDLFWTKIKTKAPCVLATNGVKNRKPTVSGVKEANSISANRKFAIYCGSAHPPNISGFFDIFGDGIGCFSPDERLIIVGGVGNHIFSDSRFQKVAGLSRACINAGTVSEDCLQGLLDTAHAIVLPISHGGGTNLKTAEAIWSGKHIIGTTTSFRGFESFKDSPNIAITDEKPKFLKALRLAMSKPPSLITVDDRNSRTRVLWSDTLHPLLELTSTR
jgi:hypothetical protein